MIDSSPEALALCRYCGCPGEGNGTHPTGDDCIDALKTTLAAARLARQEAEEQRDREREVSADRGLLLNEARQIFRETGVPDQVTNKVLGWPALSALHLAEDRDALRERVASLTVDIERVYSECRIFRNAVEEMNAALESTLTQLAQRDAQLEQCEASLALRHDLTDAVDNLQAGIVRSEAKLKNILGYDTTDLNLIGLVSKVAELLKQRDAEIAALLVKYVRNEADMAALRGALDDILRGWPETLLIPTGLTWQQLGRLLEDTAAAAQQTLAALRTAKEG